MQAGVYVSAARLGATKRRQENLTAQRASQEVDKRKRGKRGAFSAVWATINLTAPALSATLAGRIRLPTR
jgi:hypothetical protein